MRSRRIIIYTFIGVMILVFLLLSGAGNVYIDYLWFSDLGFRSVFMTVWQARVLVGVIGGLIFAAILFVNFWVARGSVRQLPENVISFPYDRFLKKGPLTWILGLVSLGLGVVGGLSLSTQWPTILQYLNRVSFNAADPLFDNDISFYMFTLPFYDIIYQSLGMILFFSIIIVAVLYFATGSIGLFGQQLSIHPKARIHLSLLAALYFFLKAWGYRLQSYKLLYSITGVVTGAGYTDVHARLPAYSILIGLAIVLGLLLLGNFFFRSIKVFVGGLVVLIVASFLVGSAYPAIIQQFIVSPNELAREREYIDYNIKNTRQAFGLNSIEETSFPVEMNLDWAKLENHPGTIDNIRLWDWRPLRSTYQQLQGIRPYYNFAGDVDVDRYTIDNSYRQVLLAARELNYNQLPSATWQNLHLFYTHGYGVVVSPAAKVTEQGLPDMWVKDIPPVSSVSGIEVKRPAIYYGQQTNTYSIVDTKTREFDRPQGDDNAYTTYDGTTGLKVGSVFRRLVFALALDDFRIMFTGEITPDSLVLMRRNITERASRIAPFLLYDADPYIVVRDDGSLVWIHDAYTVSTRYPYSELMTLQNRARMNYMRNSVKVVTDAYNGSVTFYYRPEGDPLIATWARIFPDLFVPMSDAPDDIARHFRYPEDLFRVQASQYALYHIQDPEVFYNREDVWEFPTEQYAGQNVTMDPYYTVMQLPGTNDTEFILLLPFTPKGRQNMISWLGARSDGEDYGHMLVFKFPKEKVVYGPQQIEARIDQDAEISSQLTLWGQHGSQVIRGNLLVIPIESSLLYVEPLFLEAEATALPELKRVIVAYADKITMQETLSQALQVLFGKETPTTPPVEEPPTGEVPPTTGDLTALSDAQLIQQASDLYDQARQALRDSDFAAYGRYIDELGRVLGELSRRSPQGGTE